MLLAIKLKNQILKQAAGADLPLVFSLRNISVNGAKRGCSGFVQTLKPVLQYMSTRSIPLMRRWQTRAFTAMQEIRRTTPPILSQTAGTISVSMRSCPPKSFPCFVPGKGN